MTPMTPMTPMITMTPMDYLDRLQWHGVRPGLARMETLMGQVGQPHARFSSVHIAGTNGKGSTAAMTASILQEAGLCVGLYTSPHLIHFSERIRVRGMPISEVDVDRLTRHLMAIVAATPSLSEITFFEFTTALAFLYFAEQAIDIAVIEVGLGGRFDATNVILPRVCGITQIDLDHQQYLGETLAQIAFEKAGIIKAGVPVVVGRMPEEAWGMIAKRARQQNAPLIRLGREMMIAGDTSARFLYRGARDREVRCPLAGRHQMDNAAVAIALIERLQQQGMALSEDHILGGIAHIQWAGRLETVCARPLILLDGAHNPAGAQALARHLADIAPRHAGKRWMLFGAMRDKHVEAMMAALAPWADAVILTRPDHPRAADPDELTQWLPSSLPCAVYRRATDAISSVRSRLADDDTLVITGSLYLVGEAKAHFEGATPSRIRG